MRIFVHPEGLEQRLEVADLTAGGAGILIAMVAEPVSIIYSDPPWSVGNAKWWRSRAKIQEPERPPYSALLDAWCRCVAAMSPEHVLVEQSAIDSYRQDFLDAVERCPGWPWPLLEQWTVRYGPRLADGTRRPNVLLHYGSETLAADPSQKHGDAMTRLVLGSLNYPQGTWVCDPCMGKGMTSRLAHERGWNVLGLELSPRRLETTIYWLLRHGYEEVSHDV